jgi:hypothetical protein
MFVLYLKSMPRGRKTPRQTRIKIVSGTFERKNRVTASPKENLKFSSLKRTFEGAEIVDISLSGGR